MGGSSSVIKNQQELIKPETKSFYPNTSTETTNSTNSSDLKKENPPLLKRENSTLKKEPSALKRENSRLKRENSTLNNNISLNLPPVVSNNLSSTTVSPRPPLESSSSRLSDIVDQNSPRYKLNKEMSSNNSNSTKKSPRISKTPRGEGESTSLDSKEKNFDKEDSKFERSSSTHGSSEDYDEEEDEDYFDEEIDEEDDDPIKMLIKFIPYYNSGDESCHTTVRSLLQSLSLDNIDNADESGNTLLSYSCQYKCHDLVRILLNKGANPNAKNIYGACPLHFACYQDYSSIQIARILLNNGADPNVVETTCGCTPLHYSSSSGNIALCELLLNYNASPEILDHYNYTCADYARESGYTKLADFLLNIINKNNTKKSFYKNNFLTLSNKSLLSNENVINDFLLWESHIDPGSGNKYYVHNKTGECLWENELKDRLNEKIVSSAASISSSTPNDSTYNVLSTLNDEKATNSNLESENKNQHAYETKLKKMIKIFSFSNYLANFFIQSNDFNNLKQLDFFVENFFLNEESFLSTICDSYSTKNFYFNKKAGSSSSVSSNDSKETLPINEAKDSSVSDGEDSKHNGLSNKEEFLNKFEKKFLHFFQFFTQNLQLNFDSISSAMEKENLSLNSDSKSQEKRYDIIELEEKNSNLIKINERNEEIIMKLNKQIEENNSVIRRLNDRLSESDHIIHGLNENIKRYEEKIKKSESFIEEINKNNEILLKNNENLLKNNEFLNKEIDELKDSNKKMILTNEENSSIAKKYDENLLNKFNDLTEEHNKLKTLYEKNLILLKNEEEKLANYEKLVKNSEINDKNNETNMMKIINELKELKIEHENLNLLYKNTVENSNQLESSLKEKELLIKSYDEKLLKAEDDLKELIHKNNELNLNFNNNITKFNALNDSNNANINKINELNDTIKQLEFKIEKLTNNLNDAKDQNNSFSQTIEKNKIKINNLAKEINEKDTKISILNKFNEEKTQQINEFNKELESKLNKINELKDNLNSLNNEITEAQSIKKFNLQLHKDLGREQAMRKKLHNDLEDLKGKIRVYVRIRPLSKSEHDKKCEESIFKDGKMNVMVKMANDNKCYDFDQIFAGTDAQNNSQVDIFKDTKHLMLSVIDGYNVCIFAYGQTGAGKSYTMIGGKELHQVLDSNSKSETKYITSESESVWLGNEGNYSNTNFGNLHQSSGIIPRSIYELFRLLNERSAQIEYKIEVQMFQLYRDSLEDLLKEKSKQKFTKDGKEIKENPLKIILAEHSSTGLVQVDGAVTMYPETVTDVFNIFSKGSGRRTTASTNMNNESSRSHLIFSIVIKLRNRRTENITIGKLTLVDLAGSERIDKSGATGDQLKEAQSINKSLSALGDVISALTTGQQHIPYRNHPLTMLMSDSIGGNSKTLMFVNISPADYNTAESNNALQFAQRCKNIVNSVSNNGGNNNSAAQVAQLKKELAKLKKNNGNGGITSGMMDAPISMLARPDTGAGSRMKGGNK